MDQCRVEWGTKSPPTASAAAGAAAAATATTTEAAAASSTAAAAAGESQAVYVQVLVNSRRLISRNHTRQRQNTGKKGNCGAKKL